MSNPDVVSRFNEIYDATNRNVLIYVTAKCRRTADIGDVIQDTYVELFRVLSKHGAGHIKNVNGYMMKIARQKLSRHYSLYERLSFIVPMATINENGEETDITEFEADGFLLEDFVADRAIIETAKDYIRQKPEDVKKVLYLHYDAGLSIPEIARTLSIKESNVKNRLYRTIKELRNLLQ